MFLIYENIIALCRAKNMSIAQLEKSAGLGNATIRTWEHSDPGAKKLKRVADCLGVSVDCLLAEANPDSRHLNVPTA